MTGSGVVLAKLDDLANQMIELLRVTSPVNPRSGCLALICCQALCLQQSIKVMKDYDTVESLMEKQLEENNDRSIFPALV